VVVEATILKVAEAAGQRAFGPALSEVSTMAGQRRLKSQAHPAISAGGADGAGEQLLPEEAHQVISYVSSPEFDELAFQLALHAATDSPRRESRAVDRVREQLVAHLGRTDLDEDSRREVADLLVDTLNQAIAVYATRNVRDGRVFSRQVTSSASLAAAQVRNTELLARIGEASRIFEFSERMRAQVRRVHSRIEIQHVGNRQRVAYNQLWVKPFLSYDQAARNAAPAAGPEPDATGAGGATLLEPDSLFQLQRCVVLGDPGAGKSTLANWLAYAISGDEVPLLSGRVPFLLVLRDYSAFLTDPAFSLADHIGAHCRAQYHAEPPEHAIEYLLRNGRAVVILDGLDELLVPAQRNKTLRLIENFCEEYPTTPVLVTARRVGYQDLGLDHRLFSTAYLAPFTDEQVAEYVTKWFRLDDGLPAGDPAVPDTGHPLAAAFLRESSAIAELRSNPLLLALLCALYRWDGYLPENRPSVYEDCTKLLLERWDSLRGIRADLPERQSLRGVLPEIAWWMWSERPAQASGVSRAALETKIADYLYYVRKRFDDRDTAEEVAARFVDFCSGRAWVLTEVGTARGEGLYAFTHRTFMEYFAALYLVRSFPEPADLLAQVEGQITSGGGAIVAELAVHLLDSRTERGSDFLDLLMDRAESGRGPERERIRMVTFAARCLAFLSPRESTMRRVIDFALDSAVRFPGRNDTVHQPGAADSMLASDDCLAVLLSDASRDNRGFVTGYLRKRLTARSAGGPDARPETAENVTALAAALVETQDNQEWTRTHAKRMRPAVTNWSDIEPALLELAPTAPWASSVLVAEGKQTLDAAFALHGPGILYRDAAVTFAQSGLLYASPAARLMRRLTSSVPAVDTGKLRIESPDAVLMSMVAAEPPWLATRPPTIMALIGDGFLGKVLRAAGPADPALWSLALLASLPIVEIEEETIFGASRNRLRVDSAWAREWLAATAGNPDPGTLVTAFTDALTAHGLLDICREPVEKWLRREISYLDAGSFGASSAHVAGAGQYAPGGTGRTGS
jgi:NACHT domain